MPPPLTSSIGWTGRDVDALEVRDLEERRDRPEAFERVSLALLRPLLLLRACVFWGGRAGGGVVLVVMLMLAVVCWVW